VRTFTIKSVQVLPRRLDEVFPFFADAANLERITPPWLRFTILTPTPVQMHAGTRLDYRLRVRGVPFSWQSEITTWEPPLRFVDEQRRGPYRLWVHEHSFRAIGAGTEVRDQVTYAVPGGWLVERIAVGPDVRRIFAYRRQALADLFPARASGADAGQGS
jgi:ligand-binding SRPBCC domain-containing protein